MSNRHNIATANLFPLPSIESGRKSLVFQNNLYFLARQSHVRLAPSWTLTAGNASVLWGVLLHTRIRSLHIIAFSPYCTFLKYETFP